MDDQLGRLNLITPEAVLRGVREVKEGLSFCLSLPLDLPGGNTLNARRYPPKLSPTEAEAKLKRLYDAIENGVIDVSDPSLKDRIAELTATRDQAKGDSERALAHIVKIGPAITPESLRAFATALKKKLRHGDGSFARDQVRAVAQRVEVVSRKEVRIRGLRSELLRTLTAASGVEAAVLGVRAFEPKWRTLRECLQTKS